MLAQQAVDEKSNEITAVPELLKMLDIRGGRDGGCGSNTQTEIAAQVVKGGGDYVMAVKDNHRRWQTCCNGTGRDDLEKFDGV